MLDAQKAIGVSLTESYAMLPAASVAGWYFAHPQSRYFPVGKITADQVADLAARKDWDVPAMRKLLAPNLD